MTMPRKPPTLVVLQLTGGNDPLNTVVPYGNPLYYDQRPTVRILEDQVLPIDEHYGFHPSLAALKLFWDQGQMAIVNGIGYPRPDYSHFRSMDIWYTAQPETMASDRWLGKLVRDLDPQADNVLTAVSFGRGLPRALSLAGVPVASVAELDSYGLLTSLSSAQRQAALEVFSWMYDDGWNDEGLPPGSTHQPRDPVGEVFRYMGQTGLDAQKGAAILRTAAEKYRSAVSYPKTSIGQSLRGVAQVKFADLGTRVFYTAHNGFDTHGTQLTVHGQLWREVSEAIAVFFADLRAHDAADDVIMLLWSDSMRRSAGISIDRDVHIIVADWGNERVQILRPDGTHLATLLGDASLPKWARDFIEASPDVAAKRQSATGLEAEKRFWGAVSVRVDDIGRLYVAEHSRHRIQVYERS